VTTAPVGEDSAEDYEHVSLCEALDRVLNKGAVIFGELTISVANVDLLYLGVQLVLSSVETARPGADPLGPVETQGVR
jgi:gas vesicle structural protein